MIESVIEFVLMNFTLTFFIVGLVAAAISLAMKRKPLYFGEVREAILAYFLLFSIGVSFLYNFVAHVFFGERTAAFIGWADSPFQAEVGFASLGFALVGFLAFRENPGLRLAAVLGPAGFLWGAAGVHVHQMVTTGNFAPGNAGVVFYTDALIPVIGFVLLWLRYRGSRVRLSRSNVAAVRAS